MPKFSIGIVSARTMVDSMCSPIDATHVTQFILRDQDLTQPSLMHVLMCSINGMGIDGVTKWCFPSRLVSSPKLSIRNVASIFALLVKSESKFLNSVKYILARIKAVKLVTPADRHFECRLARRRSEWA